MALSLLIAQTTQHIAGHTPAAITLSQQTEESSYYIARLLMKFCHSILNLLGLGNDSTLFIWLYVGLVFIFAMLVGMVLKWIVVFTLHKLEPHIKYPLYGHLIEHKFFTKTCRIIPPLIFLILVQFTLYMHSSIASWLTRLSLIYIIIEIAISACTVSDVIWATLDERENKKKLPLRGLVQVAKLIIWIIAIIIIAAILLDKSPGTLLAGIGAFAAVLMLVFKDSILGIVAGVQLAENDSLHVGDWITVPNGQANGIVKEVSLTDVKIINWDKTISTVPPYTLISNGFRNYRNMQESHTRRIQRSFMIDADSVVETTPDMLSAFMEIPLMKEWITKKIEQRDIGKTADVNNPAGLADGTIDTNLGVLRAYLKMYLDKNPHISHVDDCFVTTLDQTSGGIPLQIYCFTNTSAWFAYEGIQALIFEHIAAILHKFRLYTFENPSGRDTIMEGYLSPGKKPDPLFGIPYPFFNNSGTPLEPGLSPETALSGTKTSSENSQPENKNNPASTDTGNKA